MAGIGAADQMTFVHPGRVNINSTIAMFYLFACRRRQSYIPFDYDGTAKNMIFLDARMCTKEHVIGHSHFFSLVVRPQIESALKISAG